MSFLELIALLGYNLNIDAPVDLVADYHRLIGTINNTFNTMVTASNGYNGSGLGSAARGVYEMA